MFIQSNAHYYLCYKPEQHQQYIDSLIYSYNGILWCFYASHQLNIIGTQSNITGCVWLDICVY